MDKLNKIWVGLLTGLLLPIVFVYAFIGFRYVGELSPWQLIEKLYFLRGLTALIAVAVLPNLIVFYFFMNKEFWKGGKGIILAVMFYALLVAFFIVYHG